MSATNRDEPSPGVREPLRPVIYDDARDLLRLLDQRRLPGEETWLELTGADAVADAIRSLAVRGAPAIGVAAAYALAVEARRGAGPARLRVAAAVLEGARPTAVNLAWAVRRAASRIGAGASALLAEAHAIRDEDEASCRRIGTLGAALLPHRAAILTHCNAGALATAGYGTALGVVRAAVEGGNPVTVLADETRPFFQGARLTAWELHRDGIPVTLLTDGMAGWLMARGEVSCVVVGADRIAANGDVANKIGTYGLAVLAAHHGLPFYVAAPWSTIDLDTPTGAAIPIEERASEEVAVVGTQRIAPEGVRARYPAFDVTPAGFVTAIITERGVVRPVTASALRALERGASACTGIPSKRTLER
ncbi:MAG TPA: S-methyl-5-thioribose-1-phosphate isomerase [Anaeromyxobacteraceae bacterium]|nr:S-methyl-5-thioribose-1-phosphate isomerase [Anaeromyxobacteraceae bacterium]